MRDEDPQQMTNASPPEGAESVIDVADDSILGLLHDRAPEIRDAVTRLLAEGAYRDDVLLGWNSFLR